MIALHEGDKGTNILKAALVPEHIVLKVDTLTSQIADFNEQLSVKSDTIQRLEKSVETLEKELSWSPFSNTQNNRIYDSIGSQKM